MLERTRSKKYTLYLEWKVGRFVRVLGSWRSLFHSLRLGPEKALSPCARAAELLTRVFTLEL